MYHLFFLFETYGYYSRDIGIFHGGILKVKIIKVKKIKEEIAKKNSRKTQEICKK